MTREEKMEISNKMLAKQPKSVQVPKEIIIKK